MPEVSNSEAFLDPDASREYLRSWREKVDQTAAQAAAMSQQMERLRVTVRDGDDLAEVTIDAAGVLVGLKLTDRIHRFEPAMVAQAVMTALRDARATAADRAHQIAIETMGPHSLSARTIADRMRQALERPDQEQPVDDAESNRTGC